MHYRYPLNTLSKQTLWSLDLYSLNRHCNTYTASKSMCCVDKKGLLSWPIPTAEKVFFFTNNHHNPSQQPHFDEFNGARPEAEGGFEGMVIMMMMMKLILVVMIMMMVVIMMVISIIFMIIIFFIFCSAYRLAHCFIIICFSLVAVNLSYWVMYSSII